MTPGELAKQQEWMQQLRQAKTVQTPATPSTPAASTQNTPATQTPQANDVNERGGIVSRFNKGRRTTRTNTTQQTGTQTDSKKKEKNKPMPLLHFFLWLFLALLVDLLSIIPYVGVIFSWPFGITFAAYKFLSGMNWKKTMVFSGVGLIVEGIFSTLPACTLDVVLTFIKSKDIRLGTSGVPTSENQPAAAN